jgi:hypothetical protein
MLSLFTKKLHDPIINSLSEKKKVWIDSQSKGHKRPLSNVVFLCPPKISSILFWWGVLSSPLKGWPVPLPVCQLDASHRPTIDSNGRRFIPSTKEHRNEK